MFVTALVVLLGVAGLSLWAWRERPGAHMVSDFGSIWQCGPWGKQLIVDFYGLEVVLVLWMATHAAEAGTWLAFGLCVATMPLFGAMSAAMYWLLALG
jgi:hypothetical protein